MSVPEEQAGLNLYLILSSLGLGELMHSSRPVDQERIKIYQIFRAYYPASAYSFERDQFAFEKSIDRLKQRMVKVIEDKSDQAKQLTDLFEKAISSPSQVVYQQPIYPGFSIWAIRDYSDRIRKLGGIGLMMGVGTLRFDIELRREIFKTFEASAQSVSAILKDGALSSQDRYAAGLMIEGISSSDDMKSGGGDSVFTRLIMQNWTSFNLSPNYKNPGICIKKMPFAGHIQVLFDLSVLDRVGYGSLSDSYGAKKEFKPTWKDPYRNRSNAIQLVAKIESSKKKLSNEFCIKHRIPPQYICGLQVRNEEHKKDLIEILRKKKRFLL